MTEVERIASGLTEAQREALKRGRGMHAVVTVPPMLPLWTSITKLGQGMFQIGLNVAGLAVRNHILATPSQKDGR